MVSSSITFCLLLLQASTLAEAGGDSACQKNGNFPLYCTEAAAITASPSNGAHEMTSMYMPNGVTMTMDGTYAGSDPACDCATKKDDDGLSAGVIVGVVVGILAVVAIIGFGLTQLPKPKHKLPPVKSKAVETTLDAGDDFSKV
jgi:hypothetical protein